MNSTNKHHSITPFFSVCIPYHNAGKYIEECIASIVDQSFSDFEILVFDDGSDEQHSQKLIDVLEYLCGKAHKYQIIKSHNVGPLAARTHTYKKAKGTVILNIDADDYFVHSDVFQNIHDKMAQADADALIYNATRNSNNTKNKHYENLKAEPNGFVENINVYKELCCGDQVNGVWNCALKNEVVAKVLNDPCFKSDFYMEMGEDAYYMTFAYGYTTNIFLLDEVLYFYRNTDDSLVNKRLSQKRIDAQIFLVERLCECAKKGGIADFNKGKYTCEFMIYGDAIYTSTSSANSKQKIDDYKKISKNSLFAESMKNVELGLLPKHKSIVINLLKNKRFGVLNCYFKFLYLLKKFKGKI